MVFEHAFAGLRKSQAMGAPTGRILLPTPCHGTGTPRVTLSDFLATVPCGRHDPAFADAAVAPGYRGVACAEQPPDRRRRFDRQPPAACPVLTCLRGPARYPAQCVWRVHEKARPVTRRWYFLAGAPIGGSCTSPEFGGQGGGLAPAIAERAGLAHPPATLSPGGRDGHQMVTARTDGHD